MVNCATCGFENAAAARFCGGCGKEFGAGSGVEFQAERRHVCVLFCDLVGSTPLSQQLDAEDLRVALGSYQQACEAVAVRNQGFIAQYRGDSIDVYFGYPLAHEDDASRVVRCGLEMVEAVAQLATEIKVDLQVRIGIHCGRVVVGAMAGPNRSERWAIGDTPNIAARVQAEAAPGEVVVSDSLHRLLPGTFMVEPLGFRKLKGVDRLVELFKIVALGGQAAGLNVPRTPFLGRVHQRTRIKEAWESAKLGEPQFVLVRGEPGIGKSRLVEVVRGEIADERTDVVVGHCTPIATATALHPITELIKLRLGFESTPPDKRVERIAKRLVERGFDPTEAVPLISAILSVPIDPAQWPAPNLSPVRARQRTMEILIAWLSGLTQDGPALLIFEDLHWADPSTVELLRQLVASPQRTRVMALFTARPEFKPPWEPGANITEIELDALSSGEIETFIRKVAMDKPLPPNVAWQIRERAAGNPLFLEEITRSVTESGALVARENSWELVNVLSEGDMPNSMAASLMSRIDRLGDARPLFQLGATVGREFSRDLLLAVAQLPEETVLAQLDTMVDSGLIFRHGYESPIYVFKHALIRDAAYDSLLRTTRQRYHARIAEALVARFPESVQGRPELLAHHLSGAGRHADAAAHWEAAADYAAKRSAAKEAVTHLRRALSDLERLPDEQTRMDRELSVLAALAPVLSAVAGWAAPEVGEVCKRAIDLAQRLGANDRVGPPLWVLWTNQFVGGRLDEAMETAARVSALAAAAKDPMLVAIGHDASTYTRFYRGEYDVAIAEARVGLRECSFEMDAEITNRFQISAKGSMLITLAGSLWMQGRQDEAIAVVSELIAYARRLEHRPSATTALATAMFFYFYDRNWERLFTIADEVYHSSEAEGFAMWMANAGLHRGRARIGLGDVARGVAEVMEWSALFRQTGSGVIEGSATSMACEAMHLDGRSEEALVVSREGELRAKTGHVGAMMPEIYRTRGDVLGELGRAGQAEEAYCMAVDCARAQGALSLELRALTSLLDFRLDRGEPEDLAPQVRQALNAMICQPSRPDFAAARRSLARAEVQTSRPRESLRP
jgi:class 3 adenylate cyclase/tetratricopeptide (TPR) repeat protein